METIFVLVSLGLNVFLFNDNAELREKNVELRVHNAQLIEQLKNQPKPYFLSGHQIVD